MSRIELDPAKLQVREMVAGDVAAFSAFVVGPRPDDHDLEEFLREDAWRLTELRSVVTYVALYVGMPIGYAALCTDAVQLQSGERKRLRRGDHQLGHHDHPIVPALKVARLAVDQGHRSAHRGTGEALMRFALDQALAVSIRVGCRLLTVDAKDDSVAFYEGLGFQRNKTKSGRHVAMHFDIYTASPPDWTRA